MIKILYIHGLGSSSNSSTGKLLKSRSDDFVTFYNPSFPLSPKEAIHKINEFIKTNDINIVIGSSLGGFYALMSNCKYGVVINPALTPISDIKNSIGYGTHDLGNEKGKYSIDENFFIELQNIIKNRYPDSNPEKWYLNLNRDKFFKGIFGGSDELFSHYEDFKNINRCETYFLPYMHHRFEKEYENILRTAIKDVIKELINATAK